MYKRQPLEDRIAIRELLETYADAVSRVDAEQWAGCWADQDATWSIPFYPEIGTVIGKDKIVAMWVEAMKTFAGDVFLMFPGSMRIEGDIAYCTAWTTEAYEVGGIVLRDRGWYDDTLVKVDGRWYFRNRTFILKHRQTFPVKEEDKEFTS